MPQKRLLVVDDDESNRDMLGRRLFRIGYDVRLAAGGKQALTALADEHIDLVLLDLMMPEMSGLELLREIRQTRPATELPVIIVTANQDSEGVVSALRAGANDYITKPLEFAVARARIETALALVAAGHEGQRQMELYRLASVACDEGLWDWNLTAGSVEYSPRWKSMLGLAEEEITCDPEEWFSRIHPDDRRRVKTEVRAHLANETEFLVSEYRMRHKDGSWRWIENRGGAARDETGRPVRLAGAHLDITARKTIDPLTSLHNRVWLEDELRSLEERGSHAALLIFALDGFERLEENLPDGSTGPLLAGLAGRMRAALSKDGESAGASLVRTGDHEFGVLLPGARTNEELEQLAARMQSLLNEPAELEPGSFSASAHAGIATTNRGEPAHRLLLNAYTATRHAREQGSVSAGLFQRSMREQAIEKLRIEADLRRSLEEHAFILHYQPKVFLQDGSIRGVEALLRWRRSRAGLVQPEHFIPAAERTGLIVAIGRQVLERACLDAAELRRQYPQLTVSVNVSGQQFADPLLADAVSGSLQLSGLPPAALRLEITETAVMRNPEDALAVLNRLHRMGVGLKLDDFGTGYSSLMYLHRFPIDTLKIDRSFVTRLPGAPESAAIIRAILTLARSLQMDVVAEGVETSRQAEVLRDMGCEYAQGFWFSRAVELAVLRELLAGRRLPRADREPPAGPALADRAIA